MGRVCLVCRLVARDLRRRRIEAGLLFLVIAAAAATLSLGLELGSVASSQPYLQTRAATAGPDIVATQPEPGAAGLATLKPLLDAPEVVGHSGPFPTVSPVLTVHGYTMPVIAEGRGAAAATVDQPLVTSGSWVREGGVVIESSFAAVLGVGVGDPVDLGGRTYKVVGIAVTAASPPYPAYDVGFRRNYYGTGPGLVWVTEADALSLATPAQPAGYTLNLKLANPAAADTFEQQYGQGPDYSPQDTLGLNSWLDISQSVGDVVAKQQSLLLLGATLLALFGITSVTVLVGGRLTEQTRRVGLLKAVGATPGMVAAVLLAENLFLALLAAWAGLLGGEVVAPLVLNPGAGMVGSVESPSITLSSAGIVVAVAVLVALAATLVPAVRAARMSLVRALADSARPPRRRALLIRLSARLPVPALLGLRLAARRPRRAVLSMISIAITVGTVVAVMCAFAGSPGSDVDGFTPPTPPRNLDSQHVVVGFTSVLVVLAVINVVYITWTTALDSKRSLAVARALGASPRQVAGGLSAAQLVPALAGSILGVPLGIGLFLAASRQGRTLVLPPAWWLAAAVLGALALLLVLTSIPARLSARRSVAAILQAELA